MNIYAWILSLSLTCGQLIRVPFGTGGITLLDMVVSFFCIFGLIKARLRLKKPPFFVLTASAFILIAIISLILTPLRLQAGEYVISFSYTVRFFIYVLFAWFLYSGIFGDLKNNISKTILLSGIAFAFLGLLQFIIYPNLNFLSSFGWDPHYFRTVSTFLDPNFAGAFLILTLILMLPNKKTKLSIFFFGLVYLALLTTFSRSSYLMLLISGVSFSYLKKSKKLFLLTLILFLILMGGFEIYSRIVAQPRNIDRVQSASFRFNTWQQGFEIFKKNPVLGVGFNAYRYAIKEYNIGNQQFLNSHGSSGNDSSILHIASTTGIIGLLTYLYFLFSLMKSGSKIAIAAVLGLTVHSFFANSLFYPPILIFILLISAASKK